MTTKIKYHYLLGRMAYTSNIFTPFIPDGEGEDKGYWGTTLLINKQDAEGDVAFQAYKADILATGAAEWGPQAVVNGKPVFETPALKNGDSEEEEWKAGHWVIPAKTKVGPFKVIGLDNYPIEDGSPAAEQLIYSGQHVLLRVRLKAWSYMKKKGVSAYIQGLKILGGGVRVDTDGNVADGLAQNTPEDLPPSMKAAAEQAKAQDAAALAQASPDEADVAAAPGAPAPASKEDIPW